MDLIYVELGEWDFIPVDRNDVLECTAQLLKGEHKAHCLSLMSESVSESLGQHIELRIKPEADSFRRHNTNYHPLPIPLLQEPVVFGQVFHIGEEDDISKEASFYREQQHPHQLKQNWNKKEKDKGTPSGDDERSTNSNPSWVTPQTGQPYNQEKGSHPPTQGIVQPAVYDNPGSAKVIPSGKGFVNKESVYRVALQYCKEKGISFT